LNPNLFFENTNPKTVLKSMPVTNPAPKIVLFEVYGWGFKSKSAFEGYLEHYFEL